MEDIKNMPIFLLFLLMILTPFIIWQALENKKAKKEPTNDLVLKASAICNRAHKYADNVNKATTIQQFEDNFDSLMRDLDTLINLSENYNLPMTGSPTDDKNAVLSDMESIINDFIDRARKQIFLWHIDNNHALCSYFLEDLAYKIENSNTLSKYLTDSNRRNIKALREEASKEKALEEKFVTGLRQKIEKQALNAGEHFYDAIDTVIQEGQASVSLLQRRFKLTSQQALFLLGDMELCGIIRANEKGNGFSVLLSRDRWLSIKQKLSSLPNETKTTQATDFNNIDTLDGHAFEHFCAELLKKNGFKKVEVTQGSADQGVDVLAEKDGIRYAIQCKCYSSDLGNTPVQEVHAGKEFYKCHVGVVMTNRYFTKGAQELAEKTGTLLWDRSKLLEMLGSESETVLN